MEDQPNVDYVEITRAARDVMSVSRVFGTPYQQDGWTVVPVAKILGGTGSGGGTGEAPMPGRPSTGPEGADRTNGTGGGGGFAARVRPVGVYVIGPDGVHWKPALDLNRVILGGQLVGMVLGTSFALVLAARRRRRR